MPQRGHPHHDLSAFDAPLPTKGRAQATRDRYDRIAQAFPSVRADAHDLLDPDVMGHLLADIIALHLAREHRGPTPGPKPRPPEDATRTEWQRLTNAPRPPNNNRF